MSLNDPLANVLSHILNCEKKSKSACDVHPNSKVIRSVLKLMKEHGYIGDFDISSELRGGKMHVHLLGHINKCGAIKPRFSITKENYETFEKRYLPAKGFGILIVTTSKGIMLHNEALDKGEGGKLLAYCY